MPNALTFIIGADSQPFAKEMRQMEQIAATTGARVSSRFAEGAAHGSYSGVIRESITIAREAIEGRGMGRIIGSSTLLLQYLKNLVTGSQEAGGAARAAADAYEVMAFRQGQSAIQARKLANELTAQVDANAGAETAEIESALAAQEQAIAQERAAIAFDQKAAAARRAEAADLTEGAIAKREAAASRTFLSPYVGGGVMLAAGIAAAAAAALGLYEYFYGFKKAMDDASLKAAELGNDYIPKMERRTATAANQAESMAKAIERAKDAYSGANAEAERQDKILKEQYSTIERLNTLKKEGELARAKTNDERAVIEKKYAGAALETDKQKHAAELQAMEVHSRNLKEDADRAQGRIVGVGTLPTSQEDAELLKQQEAIRKNAEQKLKDNSGAGFAEGIGLDLASVGDNRFSERAAGITKARQQAEVDAQNAIAEADKQVDQIKERDKIRAENERLQKEAEKAMADKTRIDAEMEDKKRDFAQQEKDKAAIEAQELDTEKAKDEKRGSHSGPKSELNEMQKIGFAFVGEGVKEQTNLLRQIAHNTQHKTPSSGGHSAERVHY